MTIEEGTTIEGTIEGETIEGTIEGEKEKMAKFQKIITDFITDIDMVFPELVPITARCKDVSRTNQLFEYCRKIYPERFFDILYENDDIFLPSETTKVYFLPAIDFRYIWNADISDQTKNIIWKYLQLILFSVLGDVDHENAFGDTAKLFEAMSETEFKSKIEEAMENIQSAFKSDGTNTSTSATTTTDSESEMPDVSQMHEHINSLIGGKLGKLAQEIASETAKEWNLTDENAASEIFGGLNPNDFMNEEGSGSGSGLGGKNMKNIFKNLFKNPGKLMEMVKSIGTKLDEKMKSGEIKETEILEEVTDMMKKMKSMPGMDKIPGMENMQAMFKAMGGKGKMPMGGVESHLKSSLKQAKMKERMNSKLQSNKESQKFDFLAQQQQQQQSQGKSAEEIEKELAILFANTEKQEKSMRRSTTTKKK